jgi:hypothetical protein
VTPTLKAVIEPNSEVKLSYINFSCVHKVSFTSLMMNDRCVGIFASQVIRLIANIYSQTIHIYICEERPLSSQSEHKSG